MFSGGGGSLIAAHKDNIVLLLLPHVVSMQDTCLAPVCNLSETSSDIFNRMDLV